MFLKKFNFVKVFNKISFKIKKVNTILLIFIICIFLFLIIILIISLFLHRKELYNLKYKFYKNLYLDLFLLLFPIILIIFLFYIITSIVMNIEKFNSSFITIKIISYQWKWYYNYIKGLGNKINFFSIIKTSIKTIINFNNKTSNYIQNVNNNLILPVNKKIRFLFTSNDVIHSFYLPSLILKQDCIPNLYKDIYFISYKVGKYKGFCTELCGKNHSYMPIIVKFLSIINYKKWILSKYFQKILLLNF